MHPIKKALKIIARVLVFLVAVILTATIALEVPAVQTAVVRKILKSLEDGADARFEVENVHLYPFNTLIIKDLAIIDENPWDDGETEVVDTVFRAGTLLARFTLGGLFNPQGPIRVRSAEVDDAFLGLVIEPDGEYKNNISRILRAKQEEKEKGTKDVFSIKKVSVNDFRFRMLSHVPEDEDIPGYGLDWKDLDLTASLEGRDLSLSNSIWSGKVNKASISEKSGYAASHLSGSVRVGRGRTEIKDLRLLDPWSDASIPSFSMEYSGNSAFKRFTDAVRLDVRLGKGVLAMKSVSFFAPALKDNGLVAEISSGSVEGYVNDLKISNFTFKDRTSGVGGTIDAGLQDLTSGGSMKLDCKIENFLFTAEGLGNLLGNFSSTAVNLEAFAPGEIFQLDGTATGSLEDLDVDATILSDAGNVSAALGIKNISTEAPVTISGELRTDEVNVGRFIGNDLVGPCSMKAAVKAVLSPGNPSFGIDSLKIDRLTVKGYDYSGIRASGEYSGKTFDGNISCDDPGLQFTASGLLSLDKNSPDAAYRIHASIAHADLHALNFDKREISTVSIGNLDADYHKGADGNLTGTIDALGLVLESTAGAHDIGDLHAWSGAGNGNYDIAFGSSFLDGTYSGTRAITAIVRDIQDLTTKKELPALFGQAPDEWTADSYRIELNFHDSRNLLSFIAPGTYLADSSSVSLQIDSSGIVTGQLRSPRIAYKDKYLKGLSLDLDNSNEVLSCTVKGSELKLAGSLQLLNNSIALYANDNKVGLGFNFDNRTDPENGGELYITGDISESTPGSPVITASNLTSNICINGDEWRFDPSDFSYRNGDIRFEGLRISNGDQGISIEGGLSPTRQDTLMVNVNDIDLSLVSKLTSTDLGLQGLASGRALVTSPAKEGLGILLNIISESTALASLPLGTVRMGSSWDDEGGKLDFALRNDLDGRASIDARGHFSPSDKSVSLNALLDKFNLGYAAPFATSVLSRLEGSLSGSITAEGPIDGLELDSDSLNLEDALVQIAFTGVPYHVDGPLHINSGGVFFDAISIRDRYNGKGELSGGLLFDHFKDMRMDARIRLDDMECLDISESASQSFYGNVFGSGRMNITGPFDALVLDIDATTAGQGSFHIPLNGSGSTGISDLLVFKEAEKPVYIDPYDQMMTTLGSQGKKASDLDIRLRINVTPGVEANLEVDKATGNVFVGNGAGTISLETRPARDLFNINGDYTLNSGNYHFSALGIANKDFTVLDGSSIKFNGDIMDSDLDINAQYSIKTSLANLIADTTSVSTRRVVECGLGISDKLRNPKLSFSINVPDLDPMTKSRVESALSTDDKVQKQFMALLVTGNFLPDDQVSGIVNSSSNILYSNVMDIMSNQLNNLLQQLDIPLDLGLNYQESGSGTSIFDVALSTQLFNNRVSVNGNIGNRQYMSSGNEDVVGDLDIEIKMDRSGQMRLNLFSHSADEYTNYLDNSQRNGVGIAYQKEFDSLRNFIKGIFTSRSKRREMELLQASREEDRVTINIDEE